MRVGLTALVGREEELELLLRRWSRAKAGGGQVVLLSGEAGIGKSRLTVALLEAIASEPHTRLRNFCSPQNTDSPALPDHRPDRTCRWIYTRRYLASEARQARYAARTKRDLASRCSALRGDAIASKRWTLPGARTNAATAQATNTRSTGFASRDLITAKPGTDDLRGCAMG